MKRLHCALVLLALCLAFAASGDSDPVAAAAVVGEGAAEGAAASEGAEEAEPELPASVAAGQAIKADLDLALDRFEGLQRDFEGVEGEERTVIEHQIAEAKLEYLKLIEALVENLLAQEREGIEAGELRVWTEAELTDLPNSIVQHIDASEKLLRELRKQRISADAGEIDELEDRIAKEVRWLELLFAGYVENRAALESLGLDERAVRRDLHQRLATRADRLAGRIELTSDKLQRVEKRALENPDDAAAQDEARLVARRKKVVTDAMAVTVGMMDRVGLDSSDYRRLLIKATGEVTADVFRGKVALGLFQEWFEDFRSWLREVGPKLAIKLFFFALILAAFRVLAVVTRRVVVRGIRGAKAQTSQLLNNMVLGLATRGIMILGLLVGLSQLGVELGPLLAGLGIVGFIVGFALQDSLANFAAGIMILGYRPYDVDDLIEAGGVSGTVSHMSLVSTTILTLDNQTLIVPNAKIWGDVIKNVTNQNVRRVDLDVHVAHAEDVDRVERVLREILTSRPKVLAQPEPNVKLHELLESSLRFVVRPWVRTEDYWEVYWDVTREIKRRFDAEGIAIARPQRDVNIRPV